MDSISFMNVFLNAAGVQNQSSRSLIFLSGVVFRTGTVAEEEVEGKYESGINW